MRRSIWVAGAAALGCVAPALGAAQSVRPMFGVGFGLAVANGAYHSDESGDGFDTGFVGSMLVGFKLPKTPVFVRIVGNYSENGANEKLQGDLSNAVGQPTDAKFHNLGGTLDIGYVFGTTFRRVYIFGGGGPYHVRLSVTSGGATADTSETKFGWNIGGGITWDVSNMGIYIEARYVHVAAAFGAPAVTFMPLQVGILFGGR